MMTEPEIIKAIEDIDHEIERYRKILGHPELKKKSKAYYSLQIEKLKSARDAYSSVIFDGLPW